jgi:hypothetical protein
MHGEMKNEYTILLAKPEGRPRSRWEHNIRTDLIDIG